MIRYLVSVITHNATSGAGPAYINADDEDEAKEIFADGEGTTVEAFEEDGLDVWSVIP